LSAVGRASNDRTPRPAALGRDWRGVSAKGISARLITCSSNPDPTVDFKHIRLIMGAPQSAALTLADAVPKLMPSKSRGREP